MSSNTSALNGRHRFDTRKLTTMGMLTALGVICAFFEFPPLFPMAPFLVYSPTDIPILVGTLIYGPAAGVIMTIGVAFLQSLLHGSGGVIGFIMHVLSSGAMMVVVGLIYRGKRSVSRAVVAMVAGVLTMTLSMIAMNLVLTPIYMNVSRDAVLQIMLPAIIPYNLMKAGINSLVALLVYRGVEKLAVRQA